MQKKQLVVMMMTRGLPVQETIVTRLSVPHKIVEEQANYRIASEAGRELNKICQSALLELQNGDLKRAEAHISAAKAKVETIPQNVFLPDDCKALRFGGLSNAMESLSSVETQLYFYEHGKFPEMNDLYEDSEYLAGLLDAAQELARYATRRATVGDVETVKVCQHNVEELNEALLKFDFRNGPLRRKYDGLKYAVRKLVDILYEQSLIKTIPEARKEISRIECLEEIRMRYDAFDAAREVLIKQCRDVQKASKQAIFAAHRGDIAKSSENIATAQNKYEEILNGLQFKHLRRQGSLSACLEEWAEAALFQAWLRDFSILPFESMPLLSAEEYLGGLADLTGEVGRVAVRAATSRELETVEKAHSTNLAVLTLFVSISDLPPKLSKKLDALHTSVNKLDTLKYELSLAASLPTKRSLSGAQNDDSILPKKPRIEEEDNA